MTSPHTAGRTESPVLDQQRAHYAGVKARLYGSTERPAVAPVAAPVQDQPETAPEPIPEVPAVLNMLAPPSWRFLLAVASARHGLSRKVIIGPSRLTEVVRARDDAIGLIYQHTQYSLPSVGRIFGGRDHSTIFHALNKHGRRVKLVDKYVPAEPVSSAPKIRAPAKPTPEIAIAKRRLTMLQRVVKRAYANNIKPQVIAEEYGCSPDSIRVIAHRLGLKRKPLEAAGL